MAAGLVAWLVIVLGLNTQHLIGGVAPSCLTLAEGDIVESQTFTPYGLRFTQLPERPINPTGQAAPQPAPDGQAGTNTLDGMPLQLALSGGGGLSQYFWDQPLGPDITPAAFSAAGGLTLARGPSLYGRALASELARELGDRAVLVDLGSFEGALTWGDPEANRVRLHYLSWSDGTYAYQLVADRSAAQIVNLARGMVCG
jgi:hypothetical protein